MDEHYSEVKQKRQQRTELYVYCIERRLIQRLADVCVRKWTLRGRGSIKFVCTSARVLPKPIDECCVSCRGPLLDI